MSITDKLDEIASDEVGEPSEELRFPKGMLYSPLPIPAYKILISKNEHIAKDVLVALVSFMGKGSKLVFPSISKLAETSGHSRKSVIRGVNVLESLGFVYKKKKYRNGKPHNQYILMDACWSYNKMDDNALAEQPFIGRCGCGQKVKLGQIGFGVTNFHHFGCGSVVLLFATNKRKIPTSEIDTN